MNRRLKIHRSGSVLLELVVAGVLLGVVMSAAVPALRWVGRQRTSARQRQAAQLEVGNLLEELTALDWNDLTPERAALVKLSEELHDQLHESKLEVAVQGDGNDETEKQIRIELSWNIAPGRPAPPVRLSAWVFRKGSVKAAVLPLPLGEGRGEGTRLTDIRPDEDALASQQPAKRLFEDEDECDARPHPNPLPEGEGKRLRPPSNSEFSPVCQ